MEGTERARRIAYDLLDVRLIVRLHHERTGGAWREHVLASYPDRIIVVGDGTPCFMYGSPIRAYSVRSGRHVVETVQHGPLLEHRLLDETGRVLDRTLETVGDPRWN